MNDRLPRWAEWLYARMFGTSEVNRQFSRVWGRGFYAGLVLGAACGACVMWLVRGWLG